MSEANEMRAVIVNFRGQECACGARKTTRQSFCRSHYFALPTGMRERLYTEGGGYFDAFREALKFLKLELAAPKPVQTQLELAR